MVQLKRPRLHVEQPHSAFSDESSRWTNKDMDPVPAHLRKWGLLSFLTYWLSDAFNAATWQFAAGIISIGLTYRESLAIVAISFFIVSIVIAFNGATGVLTHAPFPVIARASWGFWGSYVAIVSRAILAIFWFAIQSMNGANTVRVMLGAIWPSFLRLENTIPEDQGITTNTMVSFLIFWILQVPFLCMHPNNLRWLFLVKSIVVPIAWIAILVWAFVAADGGDMWAQKSTLSGKAYSWGFLGSMTSVIGNYATLSVNQADFSRYSRISPKWQYIYVLALPTIFTFIAFIGIAATNAGQVRYGVLEWDPMALISHWSSRACRFFAAFSFALAALGVNISANSLSAANDLAALFPRYVNIRRGQIICAVFAWVLVPWKILASAGSFLNFMSAYAIFLGPIAAIMLLDFWVLHRMRYDVLALYKPHSIYRYTGGVNWRAIVAFVVGVAPSLPGFINSIDSDIDVGVGVHPYQFGWLLGFVGTTIVYMGLSYAFPPKETFVERFIGPDEIYADMAVEVIEGQEKSSDAENQQEGNVEKKGGLKSWANRVL